MAKFGLILAVCAMTAFGYWRYQVGSQELGVAQFAFIQDPSDSIPTDCDRTTAVVERALTMPQTGSGSTISLFALGDETSANEPRWLAKFDIPVIRRVIEGQRVASRAKEELLANVRNRCSDLKQTRKSPIFQGLKRVVEHIQTVGSSRDSRYLFIETDGEETENRQIINALNEAAGTQPTLPPAIENRGVNVTFCGMAETVGTVTGSDMKLHHKSKQRDSIRADRFREVWTRLFTNPELVSFEPYCVR
jgi:hypothetical protein